MCSTSPSCAWIELHFVASPTCMLLFLFLFACVDVCFTSEPSFSSSSSSSSIFPCARLLQRTIALWKLHISRRTWGISVVFWLTIALMENCTLAPILVEFQVCFLLVLVNYWTCGKLHTGSHIFGISIVSFSMQWYTNSWKSWCFAYKWIYNYMEIVAGFSTFCLVDNFMQIVILLRLSGLEWTLL